MVVEDNIINMRLMQKVLEDLGGKVSVTKDGKKARDILLKKEFDLVLMDVQMPVMDG
ncbi:MAG: response regulator [Flavobacteriia bacterium]|nr:response regulator [Flavobacteriia bacterium]